MHELDPAALQELRDRIEALLEEYLPGRHTTASVNIHGATAEDMLAVAALHDAVPVRTATGDGEEWELAAVHYAARISVAAYSPHRPAVEEAA